MLFDMKMFDADLPFAVVRSIGYESVILHRHSFIELVYIENGSAIHRVNGVDVPVKKGDVFLVSDDVEHSIRPTCAENDFKLINIIFERSFVNCDVDFSLLASPIHFLEHSLVASYFKSALDFYSTKKGAFSFRINAFILLILASLIDASVDKKLAISADKLLSSDYVKRATAFIHENYTHKLSLDSIAKAVGITSPYLQRLFKKETNTSVFEYLLRYRVEMACKMLIETDQPISLISVSIGFSDVKNFYAFFKKAFNMTPIQYRKIHKEV